MSKIYQALERSERVRADGATDRSAQRHGNGHHHHVPDASEYERLGSKIIHTRAATPFQTIMVAAPDHGEGASTVAVGLASSLAQRTGLRVVLVDANFRHPLLAEMLHVEGTTGFADVLDGDADLDGAIVMTDTPGLALLPAGHAGARRLLDTPRLAAVCEELRSQADVIIFDAPPVLPYADTLTLAAKVDRVVLVTRAERTQRGRLERATAELQTSGAAILGVVLNRKASHAPPWLERCFNL